MDTRSTFERSSVYTVPPTSPTRRYTRQTPIRPATIFHPQDPNLPPEIHFPLRTVFAPDRPPFPRFINRFNSREILLVIDGSCVNNGRSVRAEEEPVAGCSFTFKDTPSIISLQPPAQQAVTFPFLNQNTHSNMRMQIQSQDVTTTTTTTTTGSIAFRLEREGPHGETLEHTSNRAKLRAVIAALQFRPWDAEGWRRVIVLTDLEYLVQGATVWLPRWIKRDWKKPRRAGKYEYQNRDLWEELQSRIDELRARDCEVSFWLHVARATTDNNNNNKKRESESEFIGSTKRAACTAAREHPGCQVEKFTRLCGIML